MQVRGFEFKSPEPHKTRDVVAYIFKPNTPVVMWVAGMGESLTAYGLSNLVSAVANRWENPQQLMG